MKQKGFSLIELLVVVLIIGVLSSIALPSYTRSVEKSRATEAMQLIKAFNEAIYTYFAERNTCPTKLSKLLVSVQGTTLSDAKIQAKYFTYDIGSTETAKIPGTDCYGVLAQRQGSGLSYKIWNPYQAEASTKKRNLQCDGSTAKDITICKALGIYRQDPSEPSID